MLENAFKKTFYNYIYNTKMYKCFNKPSKDNISNYKIKKNIIDNECIICLEPFLKNDKLSIINKCGHYYHSKCLNLWFKKKESCPLCN